MDNRIDIVVTTIGDGSFLEGFCQQATAEGLQGEISFHVIPDRKTPNGLRARCDELARQGFRIVCPTIEEQDAYLSRLGGMGRLVPYNSDNRRNVGYLMAFESGAETILSIDDDNFCVPGEYLLAEHRVVASPPASHRVVNSDTGWYNIVDLLELRLNSTIYARGFPMSQRHKKVLAEHKTEVVDVRINAGLWSKSPDVDAMTWLVAPTEAVSLKGDSVVLGERAWSPINTQNTALHRDVIPSYYFVRMGLVLNGTLIDRYGDIFSGYFAQACARHLGHAIRVGTPIALHDRNSHDYLADAQRELGCMALLEDLLEWLPEAKLEGGTYDEAYLSLASHLEDEVERRQGRPWSDEVKSYFHHVAYCMRQWVKACRMVG